jgi:hypothetical protein
MRVGKRSSTLLLGCLLLFDTVNIYRIYDEGWPRYIKAGPNDALQVVRLPFTWGDGLVVFGIAILHVLVIYIFRKSRIVARPSVS